MNKTFKFAFSNQEYKISDQLDTVDLQKSILETEIKNYNYRQNSCYIKAPENGIIINSSDLSKSIKLTAYGLTNFALAVLELDRRGWQVSSDIPCSNYGSYTYNGTFTRKPDYEREDILELTAKVPELVAIQLTAFENAKQEYKTSLEHSLREELQELTSKETKRKQLYADLKELQNV